MLKGHLIVSDENGDITTVETLLTEKTTNFLVKYKVYSYFRDRNFVVRTGINFGVDYTVYRTLPQQCHSEYCVLAVDNTQSLFRQDKDSSSTSTTSSVAESGFRYLSAQSRTMSVSKLFSIRYISFLKKYICNVCIYRT